MSDANFLEWLRETVAEAARTADQHEALKRLIRELRVSVEARFGLAAVQVGSCLRCPARGSRARVVFTAMMQPTVSPGAC